MIELFNKYLDKYFYEIAHILIKGGRRLFVAPGAAAGLSGFELKRVNIHFPRHNQTVQNRYWVCGTTLKGVVDDGLAKRILENNNNINVKILLPSTNVNDISYKQLRYYDTAWHGVVSDNQVKSAKDTYDMFSEQIGSVRQGEPIELRLKRYGGCFPFNITIYDNHAYITFYGIDGVGLNGMSLYFRGNSKQAKLDSDPEINGYARLVKDFNRMWEKSQ